MLNDDIITAMVINGAALSHFSAFFFTNQIRLRVLLLLGNALYAVYYLIVTDEPLWNPLFWSILFIGANLIVLLKQLKTASPRRNELNFHLK